MTNHKISQILLLHGYMGSFKRKRYGVWAEKKGQAPLFISFSVLKRWAKHKFEEL